VDALSGEPPRGSPEMLLLTPYQAYWLVGS